jgi:hypothetical protein
MPPTAFGRVPGTITDRAAECVCERHEMNTWRD